MIFLQWQLLAFGWLKKISLNLPQFYVDGWPENYRCEINAPAEEKWQIADILIQVLFCQAYLILRWKELQGICFPDKSKHTDYKCALLGSMEFFLCSVPTLVLLSLCYDTYLGVMTSLERLLSLSAVACLQHLSVWVTKVPQSASGDLASPQATLSTSPCCLLQTKNPSVASWLQDWFKSDASLHM